MEGEAIGLWSARKSLYAAAAFLGIVFALLVLAFLDSANDTPKLFGLLAMIVVGGLVIGLVLMAGRSEVVLTHTALRTRGRRGAANSLPLTSRSTSRRAPHRAGGGA
jgi:hypothetical protein